MAFVLQEQVSLAPYTTLKVGGKARYFVVVHSEEELKMAVAFAQQKQLPFYVLGSGSNMLIADDGYDGVIVQIKLLGVTYTDLDDVHTQVTCAAGESLDDVVADTVERGLWGLENLSHIPGTVGATPVQNVGAYGVEIADVLLSVTVFDTEAQIIRELSVTECEFGYRDSIFKTSAGKKYIITSIQFKLTKIAAPKIAYKDLTLYFENSTPTLTSVREAVIAIRREKFPDWQTVGTAGSFFKNPIISKAHADELKATYPELPSYPTGDGMVKVSLGYILDKVCNLKGFQKGLVRLFEAQALVLVTEVGATQTDITDFVKIIQDVVFKKTKITIEREVTFLK